MEPRKVTETTTQYVQTCAVCSEDFHVSKDSKETVCYRCETEAAYAKALAAGQFLIGAEIIELEPKPCGHLTAFDKLIYIKVRTKDGKIIEFEGGGWDERYIEWEEVEDEST